MPWPKVDGCQDYQGVNWIHPLFQKRIARLIEHTKCNFPGVTFLIVFGSVTSTRCTPDSDIDIVVGGDESGSFYEPPEDNTPYDVLWDKFIIKDEELLAEIVNDGVVVYGPIHA